jgi:hypothetical protein
MTRPQPSGGAPPPPPPHTGDATGGSGRDPARFYGEISTSYRAIDDFRTKLLGFLPVATGAGVFLLLNGKIGKDTDTSDLKAFLAVAGALGVLFTSGLFAYELHGMKKCHSYIFIGRRIEHMCDVAGQFVARPHDLGGFISEPLAASLIYPASLAAWAFAAVALMSRGWAIALAGGMFLVGLGVSLWILFISSRRWDGECQELLSERLPGRDWAQPPRAASEEP